MYGYIESLVTCMVKKDNMRVFSSSESAIQFRGAQTGLLNLTKTKRISGARWQVKNIFIHLVKLLNGVSVLRSRSPWFVFSCIYKNQPKFISKYMYISAFSLFCSTHDLFHKFKIVSIQPTKEYFIYQNKLQMSVSRSK